MTRVKVDFNNLVRGGQVRSSLKRADGEIAKGDVVEAFDPREDMSYQATVVEVDHVTGRVYLAPHWEPVDSKAPVAAAAKGSYTFPGKVFYRPAAGSGGVEPGTHGATAKKRTVRLKSGPDRIDIGAGIPVGTGR